MKKLLLPPILLLLGVGGGVGAGIFLTPPAAEEVAAPGPCGDMPAAEVMTEVAAHDAEGADLAVTEGAHGGTEGEPVDAGAATGFQEQT